MADTSLFIPSYLLSPLFPFLSKPVVIMTKTNMLMPIHYVSACLWYLIMVAYLTLN